MSTTVTKQRPVAHNYQYMSTSSQLPVLASHLSLVIRQQPIQARQSSANERDHRPVDPPPIIQVKLEEPVPQEAENFLQNPNLFMCASLAHPEQDDMCAGISGQSVSSVYKLKDYDNNDCGFFVFGDLSVRVEGEYRIRFTLFEITLHGAVSLYTIYSDIFSVYSSRAFPGLLESTFLSRSFSDQGVRLRIRKDCRVQIKGFRKRKTSTISVQTSPGSVEEDEQAEEEKGGQPHPESSKGSTYLLEQQQKRRHRTTSPSHHLISMTSPSKNRLLSMSLSGASTPFLTERTHPSWPFSVCRKQQQQQQQQRKGPLIQLPPIRDIMSSLSTTASSSSSSAGGSMVEVDAAVAMVQLASPSLQQQQQRSPFMQRHVVSPARRIHRNSAVW